MDCKKCGTESSVILRKKDHYCQKCFLTNTNHKFRACIGKNKLFSSDQKVLVCLSGGAGSAVLLDLIYNGISCDNHKRLRIIPFFFYISGVNNEANTVIEQCNKYNFKVHMAHVSEYMLAESKLSVTNTLPDINQDSKRKLEAILKELSPTAVNDFMNKLQRHIFIRYANLLECNFIFTAETTTSLAINLLSSLAIGRGEQVENDIGFLDSRNEKIKILRPMKDICKEELEYYIKLNNLIVAHQTNVNGNSIQSLINNFVNDLQDNFQSTISTICKTADKIGYDTGEHYGTCIICEADLKRKDLKLTALEATNFSKTVSFTKPHEEKENSDNTDILENLHSSKDMSSFPFIHQQLCYGCSRNYSEMRKCNLPSYIQDKLHK